MDSLKNNGQGRSRPGSWDDELPGLDWQALGSGDARKGPQESLEPSLLQTQLEAGLCAVSELRDMEIIPRLKLLGDWFREGDLGFLFARRGLGKTWLPLAVAKAVSDGSECGPWNAGVQAGVLLIDCEMPPELIQARCQGLAMESGQLIILNHELLFERSDLVLNLTEPSVQDAITEICLKRNKRLLILDNLSCPFRGVNENDADAWEQVLPWLLDLRRRRIAVLIVAHSGRNHATMRGTSRREDNAFWIIRLDETSTTEDHPGSRFVSRFVKQRNSASDPGCFEWHFRPEGDRVRVTSQRADSEHVLLQWIRDGLGSATDLATEMGVSKGQISKMAKRLMDRGLIIRNKRREYEPITVKVDDL